MCACRLEANSNPTTPKSPIDLEDYYPLIEMEQQKHRGENEDSENEDVYAQLAQKERDLILAAELGKALLEKNEELTKKNEQLMEEYSYKIEELTQQKYELRLRIESMEGEYENVIKELQNDIGQLREEIEEQHTASRMSDRAKAQLIQELTQQNERLTDQLRKVAHQEEQLQGTIHDLRDQVHLRRSSMHDHVQQLSVLREEINILTERKNELERRVALLVEERDLLRRRFEESHDRIIMLEKQTQEKEHQLRSQEHQLQEYEEHSTHLQQQIEELSLQSAAPHCHPPDNSLFSELGNMNPSMSMDSLDYELSPHGQFGHHHRRPQSLFLHPSSIMEEDDDAIECDDDITMMGGTYMSSDSLGVSSGSMGVTSSGDMTSDSLNEMQVLAKFKSAADSDDNYRFRQEVFDVYKHLRKMAVELQDQSGEGDEDETLPHDLKSGDIIGCLEDLKKIMKELVARHANSNENPAKTETHMETQSAGVEEMCMKICTLEIELQKTKGHLSQLNSEIETRDEDIKRKSGKLQELTERMETQHKELQNLQQERDRLRDQAAGTLTRDQVLEQARKERDEAIAKRNNMEVELVKSKLDLMKLDGQLMEAIQQKVELSQQLEEWQIDMDELVRIQVRKQLKEESKSTDESRLSAANSPAAARKNSPARSRSPFNFWQS